MDFDDLFAAAQYAAGLSLLMVGMLQLRRWWSVQENTPLKPPLMLAMAALAFILGTKQLIWSIYGTAIAANARVTFPVMPTFALVFNIATVLACIAVFAAASNSDRASYGVIAVCVSALAVTAIFVGSM